MPRTYTGRIWIFGTGLALLFTAMLNLLRIRNAQGVKGLRLFCIAANVTTLVFAIALKASIRKSRTPCAASSNTAGGNPADVRDGIFAGEERVIPIQESGNAATFAVKAHPGARKNAITGELTGSLKVSLTSPPVEGRANDACIEFSRKTFEGTAFFRYHCLRPEQPQKVVRVSALG